MGHSIEQVVARDMCVGCGACKVQTRGAVSVTLGTRGTFEADVSGASSDAVAAASRVCPFSDDARNEDSIAEQFFSGAPHVPELGYVRDVWAGRVSDDAELLASSSGGLTSWLLAALLDTGHVDGVIHVGRARAGNFEYVVSYSRDQVLDRRKSSYSAVTLADVLEEIRGDKRRYALVGVPCFVRAARLLADEDVVLASQLLFFVGLVCGHLKSQFFGQSLAWQAGVSPTELETIDFRVKRPGGLASTYDYAVTRRGTPGAVVRPMASTIDGNWGYGAFQPNACNFCDDVFAETADVVFADAWLPRYLHESRGTNIVVCRDEALSELFKDAAASGTITVEPLTAADAVNSQAGNFRHRRVGLQVRLEDDVRQGLSVPRKRVNPSYVGTTAVRRDLIRQRRLLSRLSLEAFAEARSKRDFTVYSRPMATEMRRYDRISARQHGPVRALVAYGKRLARGFLRR